MTIERKNPIPVGVYWIDAFDLRKGGDIGKLAAWFKDNTSTVHVLSVRKRFPASGIEINKRTHYWTLFEVKSPTERWPLSLAIGAPTVAVKGTNTKIADTAKKPEVWHPVEEFEEFFEDVKAGIKDFKEGVVSFKTGVGIGGGVALLAVLYVLLKGKK